MASIVFRILVILLLLTFSKSQKEIKYGQPCETPSGERGFCVPLLQCKSLLELLDKALEIPANAYYLMRSKCEGNGVNVSACCPMADLREDLDRKAKRLLPPRSVCGHHLASSVPDDKITKLNEFPWTVQIWSKVDDGNPHFTVTTGSLITQDYVLTTAYSTGAFRNFKPEFVRLGDWKISSPIDCSEEGVCANPVVQIDVAEIIVHEKYHRRFWNGFYQINDIALLRLIKKIAYSDFIRPICFPPIDLADSYFDGAELVVTSWGDTIPLSSKLSDIKGKVTLIGTSREYCTNVYKLRSVDHIHSGQLCAVGIDGRGTCDGDIGAPLMALNETDPNEKFWVLAGVVSVYACGEEGVPTVGPRMSFYYYWILSKLRYQNI